MQLDRTRIVIRERSFADVLDLALAVVRQFAGSLGVVLVAGVAPLFALNTYLLWNYHEPNLDLEWPLTHMVFLVLLVLWEIPLATAPATLYLGQALFDQRPSPRRIFDDLVRLLPQLLWYQVVLRIVVLLPPTWPWWFTGDAYTSEVILLERTPFRGRTGRISTRRRLRMLHGGRKGDLFRQWITSIALGAMLVASWWGSMWAAAGLLFGQWDVTPVMLTHGFHLVIWLVVGLFAVVRFLAYLDLRIRREGWEVELLLRAEGVRLREMMESGSGA